MKLPFAQSKFRLIAVFVLAVTLAIGSVAWARSGGSFGGGFRSSSRSSSSSSSSRSFGSSSSGSSFGSSRSSYSSPSRTRYVPVPVPVGGGYHHSYGGYSPYRSYSSYHYGYGSSGIGWLAMIFLIVALLVVIWIVAAIVRAVRRAASGGTANTSGGGGPSPSSERCDVWLMQFGVQMAARDIQDTLENLAARVDADSEDSLSFGLRTLAQELTQKMENVEYAAIQGTENMQLAKAEDQFQLWSGNERAKFNREVIRGSASGVRRQQKEWQTDGIRDEDGQMANAEFFVISVVLASKGIKLQRQINGGSDLADLLTQLGSVMGDRMVALEIVWSPAAKSDAMGREDMVGRYPELTPV